MVSSAVSRAGPVSRQAVVAANLPAHRRGCPAEARRNGAQGHAGGQSTGDLLPLDQVQRPRPTPPRSWPRPTARQLQGPDGAGEAAERRRHRGCRFASSEPVPDLSPFCFGEPSSSSHDTSRGQRSSLLARGVASTDGLQARITTRNRADRSRRGDSNSRPAVYETAALPLSYVGAKGAGTRRARPSEPLSQLREDPRPPALRRLAAMTEEALARFAGEHPLSVALDDEGDPPATRCSASTEARSG